MSQPSDPKRIVIRDRTITVLKAITKGSDYFYEPFDVTKRFIHWREAKGFPTYMVHFDSGGENVTLSSHQFDSAFYLSIKGIVRGDAEDPQTALIRANRDIQKAIDYDSHSGGAGSLVELGVLVKFEEQPITDNGYLAVEGFGFFDQRVRFQLISEYGTI